MVIDDNIKSLLTEQTLDCSLTCIFDDNYDIVFFTTSFSKLLGYNENELRSFKVIDLSSSTQTKNNFTYITNTLKSNDTWEGEIQLKHADSEPVWLDCCIKNVPCPDDQCRYVGHFTHATPRKKLIEHLKKRAHRQSLIAILGQVSLSKIPIIDLLDQALAVISGSLNTSSSLILEIAVNGKSALVRSSINIPDVKAGTTILNIDKNNLIGYTLSSDTPVTCNSIHNEKRFKIPEELDNPDHKSLVCLLIGDQNYPFGILSLFSTSLDKFNFDEINFLQSICNILAEAINRKNMEASIRYERELSRNYLDLAEVIIIIIDMHEKIILANQYASNLLGYSQSELKGKNFIETFIPEDSRDTIRSSYLSMFSREPDTSVSYDIHGNVIPIISRDKTIRKIKWKNSIISDKQKSVASIISAGEDITDLLLHEEEQKNLEHQLAQAQKMEAIGMLADGIAHDFNNILASILGFSDLAIEGTDKSNTKILNYLDHIKQSGIKARDIIAQMQNINLQNDVASQPIMLPGLLKSTLKMLRSALPSSIDLNIEIADDIPAAYTDAARFNQLLMQLLINARNALNGKGSIYIRLDTEKITAASCSCCGAALDDDYVCLSIIDDGPGISRDSLEASLLSSSRSSTRSGLTIANDILHKSHAHMLINSHSLNPSYSEPGTCITLLFPIGTCTTQTSLEEQEIDISRIAQSQLMIVDDENSVASYMGELFKNAGFSVEIYGDSIEAYNAFKSQPGYYDLIITDQTMPAMTGDILAAKLLAISPDLPIILCTGHSSVITEEMAHEQNIKGFLKKPVESTDLLQLTVRLLAESINC